MSEINVEIIKLGPLHVASAYGFGKEPEGMASDKLLAFARQKGLLNQNPLPRTFGFNNPSPTPGSENYGYEMWMVIGPEIQAEGDIKIKDFPGGLYGVTRVKNVENIPGAWENLSKWLEKSPYRYAKHQWLEEHIDFIGKDWHEFVIDLLIPIQK